VWNTADVCVLDIYKARQERERERERQRDVCVVTELVWQEHRQGEADRERERVFQ